MYSAENPRDFLVRSFDARWRWNWHRHLRLNVLTSVSLLIMLHLTRLSDFLIESRFFSYTREKRQVSIYFCQILILKNWTCLVWTITGSGLDLPSLYWGLKHCHGAERTLCPPLANNSINPQWIKKGASRSSFMSWLCFKGIVSRDWGGLLMILLDRLEVFNISPSRFFLFLSAFSYSYFKNSRLSGASFQHNSSKDQYKSGDSNSLA